MWFYLGKSFKQRPVGSYICVILYYEFVMESWPHWNEWGNLPGFPVKLVHFTRSALNLLIKKHVWDLSVKTGSWWGLIYCSCYNWSFVIMQLKRWEWGFHFLLFLCSVFYILFNEEKKSRLGLLSNVFFCYSAFY